CVLPPGAARNESRSTGGAAPRIKISDFGLRISEFGVYRALDAQATGSTEDNLEFEIRNPKFEIRNNVMETLLKDIRYAIRSLTKRPGSTAIAVITLALGIGANASIFSFVNGLLLRPLAGVERPERLVGIYTSDFSSGRYGTSSYLDYLDFRRQSDAFTDIAAYESGVMNLAGAESSERLRGAYVTSNYFDVLGVGARVGRTLKLENNAQTSADPVVVISHALWQR
ncbi:MAG: ABC transporter permease, partial [Pyrinomonadaceae bacterium]